MLVSYKWLQTYFSEKLPSPEELVFKLTHSSFEIEGLEEKNGDYIIDVDVLPNRAHDCLSHKGIAKEISVITGLSLVSEKTDGLTQEKDTQLEIDIQNTIACRTYSGRIIRNIKVDESPQWLKERLTSIGQRSINNIVDATNFIMFEIGQPLHAFDLSKLASEKIIVRNSNPGEKIITLTGDEVVLQDTDLLISDENTALAIAGVKGGNKAEVTRETKDIVIESANFDPVTVRKTSRRIGILTDSSKRFENEITPMKVEDGMEKVSHLIMEIAATGDTVVEKVVSKSSYLFHKKDISISVYFINELLGTTISEVEVEDIFKRLDFKYIKKDGTFVVTVPIERLDITIPEDLVEEVGRIYGYEKIPSLLPAIEKKPSLNKEYYYVQKIKNFLIEKGFSEVYTYSLEEKGDIEIANPLASDKGFLRNSLKNGLLQSRILNEKYLPLLGIDKVKIFEIGKVFSKDKEYNSLGIAISDHKKSEEEIKNDIQLLSQLLNYEIKCEYREGIVEINLDVLIEKLPPVLTYEDLGVTLSTNQKKFRAFSLYPFVLRDIAVFIPDGDKKEDLEEILKNEGGLLLRTMRLFDVYKKVIEGISYTSYAYNLVFQSDEKTLTDTEVHVIMDKINEKIKSKRDWIIR